MNDMNDIAMLKVGSEVNRAIYDLSRFDNDIRDYSGVIGWAFHMEEEIPIEKRSEYTKHLTNIVMWENTDTDEGTYRKWDLVHATPLQRCKARLMMEIVP